jgi:hypothetical protein
MPLCGCFALPLHRAALRLLRSALPLCGKKNGLS